jgi:DNA gyrase inhibitor GyrI
MNKLKVDIVRLEPMKMASFYAFGESPEGAAAQKLISWADPRGLLKENGRHRIFGFDNPSPSPGSPNYGYEFWLALPSQVEVNDNVEVKEFSGGLYAVTRCKGLGEIGKKWTQLVAWRESSQYKEGTSQCLEEQIGEFGNVDPGEMELDLFLSIAE